jgi:hypothetical protein
MLSPNSLRLWLFENENIAQYYYPPLKNIGERPVGAIVLPKPSAKELS